MPRSELAGTRIRERRLSLGVKQAALARQVEISPSYLNLIEHNRRAIAGKLLTDIARSLDVEASALIEGAETTLIAALREAEERVPHVDVERDRVEDFAARFPGWAALVQAQSTRITQLERTVDTLQDRLSHDPFLSTAMHDVLSTVTSLHATASILAGEGELEPQWRGRFEKNIFADSERLSEASQALVAYLDNAGDAEAEIRSPQEDVQTAFARFGFYFPSIEADPTSQAAQTDLIAQLELSSDSARELAARQVRRYAQDAAQMPMPAFVQAALACQEAPLVLAQNFNVPLSAVLRRFAARPAGSSLKEVGLVVADNSGTFLYRQPIVGFDVPRFGAGCPLWPLFQAFTQPNMPVRMALEQAGPTRQRFEVFAIAEPRVPPSFNVPPVMESTMLIRALDSAPDLAPALEVGPGCRVCPRENCAARRELSILSASI